MRRESRDGQAKLRESPQLALLSQFQYRIGNGRVLNIRTSPEAHDARQASSHFGIENVAGGEGRQTLRNESKGRSSSGTNISRARDCLHQIGQAIASPVYNAGNRRSPARFVAVSPRLWIAHTCNDIASKRPETLESVAKSDTKYVIDYNRMRFV